MGTVIVGGKVVQTDTQPYTPHGTGAMAQSVWGGGSGPPGGGSQTAAAGAAYEEAQEQGIQDLYMAQAMQEADMTPTPSGVYDQALQQAAAAQEAEDKAKTEIIKPKTDFSLTGVLSNMNMGKYAEAAAKGLFGWVKHPKAEQFTNLNDLAIIKALLGGASGKSVDEYYKKYKDIINEGLGLDPDDPWGQEEFEKKLEDAFDLGMEGEESQFRLNPEKFYEKFDEHGEAFYATPQTTGELKKLAGIDVNMLNERGEPLSDEFKQQIFNARNELDKQTGGQGGGQGIADLSPVAQLAATTPEEVAAATVPAEVAAATTTPAATTTAAATEPTPFDYSQWPQYAATNQYPWPNYVNQGLGQWPNFDYWNQIANAFPGMSQYG